MVTALIQGFCHVVLSLLQPQYRYNPITPHLPRLPEFYVSELGSEPRACRTAVATTGT